MADVQEFSAEYLISLLEDTIGHVGCSDVPALGLAGSDGAPAGGQGSKPKKRPLNPANDVKALEQEVAQLQLRLEQEQQEHLVALSKLEVLHLVLATKDAQVARVQQIQEGLDFNPFEAVKSTAEEAKAAPTTWSAKVFPATISVLAEKLAKVMPLPEGRTLSPEEAASPEHQDLIAMVQGMLLTLDYCFFAVPSLLLTSSLYVHLADVLGEGLVAQLPEEDQTSNAPSTVAPQAHWLNIAKSMQLSPQQHQQAFFLSDIINKARASILQQRSALVQSITQLHRHQQQHAGQLTGVAPSLEQSSAEAHSAMWRHPQHLQQEEQLLERLNKTVAKERALVLLAGEVMRSKILMPAQFALYMVSSYPWFPDDMAIIHACATLHRPPLQQ